MKRVVITGLGTVNPLASDVDNFYKKLLAGENGIREITKFDPEEMGVYVGGEVSDDFDPETLIEKRKLRRFDPFTIFGVYAAKQAFIDAGLDKFKFDPFRFSSIMSTGAGGLETYVEQITRAQVLGTRTKLHPMTLVKALPNMSTGSVAIELNAKGSNLCIITACASGTHSIGEGMHQIKRGDADIIVAGASDAIAQDFSVGSFKALKALSTSRDVNRASIPFDKQRDGFVLSEGAGAVILEDLDHALARGAKIYAEVVGYGSTCDASHITAPSQEGPVRSMEQAINSAGIKPSDVDYINAHGTSTPINDANETKAIKTLFGDYAKKVKISSIKSSIGHTLGAAGAIEAVMIAKALGEGIVPGTINTNADDPECDLDYMIKGSEKLNPKYIISNSFGFGGHNGTLVFKKWEGK